MLLESAKLSAVLGKKLNWLDAKAQVHAQNISNADVPGKREKNITEFSAYLNSSDSKENRKPKVIETGQEIAREWEVVKMTETNLEHQAVLAMLTKYMSMIRTVIGKQQ
jgi:flagellar basal body rod protein FlgB